MIKRYLIFIILCNILILVKAQQNQKNTNSQYLLKYDRALVEIEKENYLIALSLLNDVLELNSNFVDAKIAIARIYFKKKNYEKCIEIYKNILASNTNYNLDYFFEFAIAYAGVGNFEEALKQINIFLSQTNLNPDVKSKAIELKSNYEFGIKYYKENKDYINNYKFIPQNLGENVNSVNSEYFPTLTFDAKKIIFTRRVNNRNEDFFESQLEENNEWSVASKLSGNVNTPLNEGTQSVSLDERWLAFTGCNFPDGNGSCDIYFSYKTYNGWAKPYNIGNKINSEFWESQPAFSPDKRILYFASKRPEGYGGSDIYMSYFNDDGTWSFPINLGDKINTPADEISPFIHSDNATLYFTSNGWSGYGGMDIFMSQKDSLGQWKTPKNLGFPINTIENESCLFITSDGKEAFYSSDRADSKGGLDIYKFILREDIRPKETFWVKLRVEDRKKNKLPASINILDMDFNAVTLKPMLLEDSTYLISLIAGRKYFISAQFKNYIYNYDINHKKLNDTPLVRIKTIRLDTLKANSNFTLKNIYFDINQSTLKASSIAELNALLTFLKINNNTRIKIDGHTDNTGDEKYNMELSIMRAGAVFNFLTERGIQKERLQFEGFGFTKPISNNNSEQGKKLNRRTEILIVDNNFISD